MATRIPDPEFDGRLLGDRYRLGPRMARGGQGTTYRALDTVEEEVVALKEFKLSEVASWKELELFERECRVLHGLDHPGIPNYRDEGHSDEGTAYLVMELIPGRSFDERLREEGPLGEDELWDLLKAVSEILAYLHRRVPPIVHRDIKPANLLERPDGGIALVDFGGVRDALRPDGGSTVVGTFGYMAPEQLHGGASPATDMYSLAATLVKLGTGIEPENIPRKGLRMDFGKKLKVKGPLRRLLRRMLEPDPDRRPASAVKLLEEIEKVEAKRASSQAPRPARPAPRHTPKHKPRPKAPPRPKSPRRPVSRAPTPARRRQTLDLPPAQVPPKPLLPSSVPWPLGIAAGVLAILFGLAGSISLRAIDRFVVGFIFLLIGLVGRRDVSTQRREVGEKIRVFVPMFEALAKRGRAQYGLSRKQWIGERRRRKQLTDERAHDDDEGDTPQSGGRSARDRRRQMRHRRKRHRDEARQREREHRQSHRQERHFWRH